jgi:hypothetical protein
MTWCRLSWFYGWIRLTKHKSFEYEWGRKFSTTPFEFSMRLTTKGDHAGFRFAFSIYKLFFLFLGITDNRHWSNELDRFYTEEEHEQLTMEWEALNKELDQTTPTVEAIEAPAGYTINSLGDVGRGKLN